MTRFVFIADTHLGARPMEFQQQPGYPEKLDSLLAVLNDWICRDGGIDFVLHGGDLVDACRVDLIDQAVAAFHFAVPCFVCLGNHDLTRPDAEREWLERAPGFFLSDSVHFEIVREDCVIHVVPSHWDEDRYHWKDVQAARLSADQIERMGLVLGRYQDRPHVLCTHSQILAIPPEQTGLDAPEHEPWPSFQAAVFEFIRGHPGIRCVLGGHNHTNTLGRVHNAVAVSVSAFASTPFEFKIVEVSEDGLAVSTLDLFAEAGFEARYDFNRAFVQGRACDRQCRISLSKQP